MAVIKIVLSADNPNNDRVRAFFETLEQKKRDRGEKIISQINKKQFMEENKIQLTNESIGKRFKRKDGEVVVCEKHSGPNLNTYSFSDGNARYSDGGCLTHPKGSSFNIISEILEVNHGAPGQKRELPMMVLVVRNETGPNDRTLTERFQMLRPYGQPGISWDPLRQDILSNVPELSLNLYQIERTASSFTPEDSKKMRQVKWKGIGITWTGLARLDGDGPQFLSFNWFYTEQGKLKLNPCPEPIYEEMYREFNGFTPFGIQKRQEIWKDTCEKELDMLLAERKKEFAGNGFSGMQPRGFPVEEYARNPADNPPKWAQEMLKDLRWITSVEFHEKESGMFKFIGGENGDMTYYSDFTDFDILHLQNLERRVLDLLSAANAPFVTRHDTNQILTLNEVIEAIKKSIIKKLAKYKIVEKDDPRLQQGEIIPGADVGLKGADGYSKEIIQGDAPWKDLYEGLVTKYQERCDELEKLKRNTGVADQGALAESIRIETSASMKRVGQSDLDYVSFLIHERGRLAEKVLRNYQPYLLQMYNEMDVIIKRLLNLV